MSVAAQGRLPLMSGPVANRKVSRLCCKAFSDVFRKRQTKHRALVAWLAATMTTAWQTASTSERAALQRLIGT
jgi:hypothetical protein